MYLSIENFTCPKDKKWVYTFQSWNKLFFQKQYETKYISTLVNSMDPDQLASLENSVDPDQLTSEEASWWGYMLFSMQDVSS